jgi:hypothetical protein
VFLYTNRCATSNAGIPLSLLSLFSPFCCEIFVMIFRLRGHTIYIFKFINIMIPKKFFRKFLRKKLFRKIFLSSVDISRLKWSAWVRRFQKWPKNFFSQLNSREIWVWSSKKTNFNLNFDTCPQLFFSNFFCFCVQNFNAHLLSMLIWKYGQIEFAFPTLFYRQNGLLNCLFLSA